MPWKSGKLLWGLSGKDARSEIVDVFAEYRRLTGLRVGRTGWDEAIHPEDRKRVLSEWEHAQRCGRFLAEYRLRYVTGAYHYVRGSSRRVRGILRDRWMGYIRRVHVDHRHICAGPTCYCISAAIG